MLQSQIKCHLLRPAIFLKQGGGGDCEEREKGSSGDERRRGGKVRLWMLWIVIVVIVIVGVIVRGAVQTFFWVNLGFCPNRLDPPLPPRTLGHQQLKKKF